MDSVTQYFHRQHFYLLLLLLMSCQVNEDNSQQNNKRYLGVIVSVENDNISIVADQVSLDNVITELSRELNIEVIKNEPLTKIVSVNMKGLNLPQVLKLLLDEESYSLIWKSQPPTNDSQSEYQLRIASAQKLLAHPPQPRSMQVRTQIEYQSQLSTLDSFEDLPKQQAIVAYHQALGNPHIAVKLRALELLKDIDDPQVTQIIAEQLQSQSTTILIHALKALALIQQTSVLDEVTPLLVDYPTPVRIAAINTLGAIGSQQSIAPLSNLVTDPNKVIRLHLITALDNIGGADIIPLLIHFSQDADVNVRASASSILKEMGL